MSSVETIGRTIIVRVRDHVIALTATDARWLGQQMIARADDLERQTDGVTQ